MKNCVWSSIETNVDKIHRKRKTERQQGKVNGKEEWELNNKTHSQQHKNNKEILCMCVG